MKKSQSYGILIFPRRIKATTTSSFDAVIASGNIGTGLYDLSFRNYDPTIGRFVQVDPLAYTQASLSPYQYGGNNPILNNDPSGLKFNGKSARPDWLVDLVGEQDGYAGVGAAGSGLGVGAGGGFGGGGSSASWNLLYRTWNATPAGTDRTFTSNADGTFSSFFYVEHNAQVAIDAKGDPIDGTERGYDILYMDKVDLDAIHSMMNGSDNTSHFWNDADNINDMITSMTDIPALAGGISRMNMGAGKSFSQLRRVVSTDTFKALKGYNNFFKGAGKVLGVVGLVTSVGELLEEPFSWTNVAKVGVNVLSMGIKATPLGLTVSLGIGLLDSTGMLDVGFNALFNEKTE